MYHLFNETVVVMVGSNIFRKSFSPFLTVILHSDQTSFPHLVPKSKHSSVEGKSCSSLQDSSFLALFQNHHLPGVSSQEPSWEEGGAALKTQLG